MTTVITSSVLKLLKHPTICSGHLHPISSQIVLTDKCNLNCSFCTAGGSSRAANSTLPAKTIEQVLEAWKFLGCKGIEYTGGGEPTLHPDFPKIVAMTKDLGFDIGLITNGTRIRRLSDSVDWSGFDWVRVSVNAGPKNYREVHGRSLYNSVVEGLTELSEALPGRFGISYIYSEQPPGDLWELMSDVAVRAPNTGYVRVGADIKKGASLELASLRVVANRVREELGIFIDMQADRDVSVPDRCTMGRIKPCVDGDGSVYPCCVAQHKKFGRLCGCLEYKELFLSGQLPEIVTEDCPYCIYREVNDFALSIEASSVKNPNFI